MAVMAVYAIIPAKAAREEVADAVGGSGNLVGHWWQQLGECSES